MNTISIAMWSILLLCTLSHTNAKTASWQISPRHAKTLFKRGALFLDTRSHKQWKRGHVRNAQHVQWSTFSPKSSAKRGTLLSNNKLAAQLNRLGVDKHKSIVVLGHSKYGWGEDGRIVWMLRTLGHKKAYFVDGGYDAVKRIGLPITKDVPKASRGSFRIKKTMRWSIKRRQIRKILKNTKRKQRWLFVDTRELREFRGKTPYGEKRGGHLPGAIHLHFKALMNKRGYLRSRKTLKAILKRKGITPDKRIVAYCTGGIRSAWFVAILRDLGYKHVKNYAGSMWEWSSYPKQTHPLQK